jgi:hypothetical protein
MGEHVDTDYLWLGIAHRWKGWVVVPDVRTCEFMAGSEDLEGYLGAGILVGGPRKLPRWYGVTCLVLFA